MAKWLVGLFVSTALMPVSVAAQAVGADAAASETGASQQTGGDIIVTAQRYEQRLQDVPMSISAVTADELASRNITNINDLQYSIPGLSTYRYGTGQEFYQLQGVSNQIGAPTVGIYLDETPLSLNAQGSGLSVQTMDLERLEVLRGPQATMYGEGSMGGTIRYIPAAPKLDRVEGSVEGEVSMMKDGETGYRGTGVLNLPLVSEKLGLRVVAAFQRDAGWIDSSVTGQPNVNGADVLTLRATLLAKPTDRLTLSVMGMHGDTQQDYQDFGVNRVTNAQTATTNKDEYWIAQGKAIYETDFADLTAIGGYIRRKNNLVVDLTSLYLPFLPLFGVPAGSVSEIGFASDGDVEVKTAELRLQSNGDGPLGWLLGATYRDLDARMINNTDTRPNPIALVINASNIKSRSQTYAGYGEVNYALSDSLKIAVGARYYHQVLEWDNLATTLGSTARNVGKGTFNSFNPRVNVSFNISPDSMIYASASKGFRGGGFNDTSSGLAVSPTYDPDKIWTYEIGTKHQLFQGRLSFDASVYRSIWSDVQSYNFLPGSPATIISNAGDVRGWGVDVAASARPVRGLTLSGTFGWNNLAYIASTADKLKGDPVDGAIRLSYSASGEYRVPVGENASAFVRADYMHSGRGQISYRNFGGQVVERPSRDLVNLRVGTEIDNLELSVFASNLFDVDQPIIVGPNGLYQENLEQRPRIIGVNARIAF